MNRPARTVPARALLATLAAGAILLAGCKSGPRDPIIIKTDDNVRSAEARKLAAEADREQKAGHIDKAIELYQKSLEQSRDLFFVWNNLGLLLMEKENYPDAAELFTSAADLAPSDPRPYYNLGLIYQKVGYDEKALEYFVKSLQRVPRYVPALRGAVVTAKRLDISDDEALKRVRMALMVETLPQWRRIFEAEQLRIEGTISRASRGIGAPPNPRNAPKPESTPPQPAPGGEQTPDT